MSSDAPAWDFDYFLKLYAASEEPFPAAAATWRMLNRQELAALTALSTWGVRADPLADEWLRLSPQDRTRALVAMRRAIELGAACAKALQLEAGFRSRRGSR